MSFAKNKISSSVAAKYVHLENFFFWNNFVIVIIVMYYSDYSNNLLTTLFPFYSLLEIYLQYIY